MEALVLHALPHGFHNGQHALIVPLAVLCQLRVPNHSARGHLARLPRVRASSATLRAYGLVEAFRQGLATWAARIATIADVRRTFCDIIAQK